MENQIKKENMEIERNHVSNFICGIESTIRDDLKEWLTSDRLSIDNAKLLQDAFKSAIKEVVSDTVDKIEDKISEIEEDIYQQKEREENGK